ALVGGAPATVELEISPAKVVADGHSSAEVRVRVVDQNGTPTVGSGIAWSATGGHVAGVSSPSVGFYFARFIPALTTRAGRGSVSVTVPPATETKAQVELEAPFHRLALTPRVGFYTNFGRL